MNNESKTIKELLNNPRYEIFCLACNSQDYNRDKNYVCLFGYYGKHTWKYRDRIF